MTQLYTLLGDELVNALGWTFVHSLWQGSLVALIMTAVLSQIPSRHARRRYVIATISLLSVLLCSTITFLLLYYQPVEAVTGTDTYIIASAITTEGYSGSLYAWISQFNPLFVSVWIIGVLFFALRFCFGLGYLQHLKSHTTPATEEWQMSLDRIVQTLGITRPVRLAQSALIRIPVVTGYFKPVILFPLGVINQLGVDEVEAILAHEVAHLVRNDFIQNLAQALIEMVFYYHPAVWWISAVVRSERENCCDDLAVQICTNSLTYAKALVRLEDIHHQAPALALPFAGSKGHLLNRIKRILNQPQTKSNVMERIIATVILIGCVTLLSFTEKNTEVQSDAVFLTEHQVAQNDTVPAQKDITILKTDDGKEIEMRSKNGKIQLLKIDGNVIDPSEYSAHEAEIEEIRAVASNPPELPPLPPVPAMAPMPPMPPMPPGKELPPMPPLPELPPMPEMSDAPEQRHFDRLFFVPEPSGSQQNNTNTTTIIREKSGNGYRYHVESNGDESNVIIDGDRGIATINGQEIELDADSVIVIEAIEHKTRDNAYNFNYRINTDGIGAPRIARDSLALFEYRIARGLKDDGQKEELKAYEQQMREYEKQMDLYGKQLEKMNWEEYGLKMEEWSKQLENQDWKQYGDQWKEYSEQLKKENGNQWKAYEDQIKEYQIQLGEVERESARDALRRSRELLDQERERQTESRDLFRDQTERARVLEFENNQPLIIDRQGNFFAPSPVFSREPFGPITSTMDRDGLIDKDGEYRIILEENKLRINGKRQPDDVHRKYLNLFEKSQGYEITGKTKIEITN